MQTRNATARGLILIVLDTLRADFETLVASDLPHFGRLRELCTLFPPARCGSFPTGPMRTDLLTGRLAFLDAEWALPRIGEKTLPRMLSEAGVRTTLVSDNYVAVIPRLGGMLINEFDTIDFIRGAGSDPWITPPRGLWPSPADVEMRPPTRSLEFEIQYLANVQGWAAAGGSPTQRVVVSAMRALEALAGYDRFLLWIDSFAIHEPWAPLAPSSLLPEVPLFPAYVEADHFPPRALEHWRRQYVDRIVEVDSEIAPLVDQLERVTSRGDVAVAVVSDHGFLFGDFGFVGKAPNTPLPPSLHEILCWLSPHFEHLLRTDSIQPHDLHYAIRRLFGLQPDSELRVPVHVFGRNSPRSAYIAAATIDDFYVGAKTSDGKAAFMAIPRAELDPALPLMSHQAWTEPPAGVLRELREVLTRGSSAWLHPFQRALGA